MHIILNETIILDFITKTYHGSKRMWLVRSCHELRIWYSFMSQDEFSAHFIKIKIHQDLGSLDTVLQYGYTVILWEPCDRKKEHNQGELSAQFHA